MFNIIILNYFHCFFTNTIKIVPVQTILSQFKNKLFQSKNWTTTYTNKEKLSF